jgi:hypothetical protein
MHELSSRLWSLTSFAAILQLADALNHLLDDAHCILVKSETQEIGINDLHKVYRMG